MQKWSYQHQKHMFWYRYIITFMNLFLTSEVMLLRSKKWSYDLGLKYFPKMHAEMILPSSKTYVLINICQCFHDSIIDLWVMLLRSKKWSCDLGLKYFPKIHAEMILPPSKTYVLIYICHYFHESFFDLRGHSLEVKKVVMWPWIRIFSKNTCRNDLTSIKNICFDIHMSVFSTF